MNYLDAIRIDELSNGEGFYLPIMFCLDTSSSMERQDGGTDRATGKRIGPKRIEQLRQGVDTFMNAIYRDEASRYSVEVAVVTFDDTARVLKEFSLVERPVFDKKGNLVDSVKVEIPTLETRGRGTAMGEGLNLALDLIEQCKADYRRSAVEYYQPWLVLITDGINTGSEVRYAEAAGRLREAVDKRKLSLYPIAIGTDQGRERMNELSPAQKAINLKSDEIPALFQFLSRSAVSFSDSQGRTAPPVLEDFKLFSWAESLDKV